MIRAWLHIFDYSGRATRWHIWNFIISYAIIIAVVDFTVFFESNSISDPSAIQNIAVVNLLVAMLFLPVTLPLYVRRFHDFDWSGWGVLVLLVPLVNLVFSIMLLFRGGTPGFNRFGHEVGAYARDDVYVPGSPTIIHNHYGNA